VGKVEREITFPGWDVPEGTGELLRVRFIRNAAADVKMNLPC
jgi:hypothetical protein